MYGVTHPQQKKGDQRRKSQKLKVAGTATSPPVLLPPISAHRQGKTASGSYGAMYGAETGSDSGRACDNTSVAMSGVKPELESSPQMILEMNKEAMTLLNKGKMGACEDALQAALQLAESNVQRCRQILLTSASECEREELQVWQLVFATTLNNMGSVQRRINQPQDALRYMQNACDVEEEVFGQPTCSTLVNLSAVMLTLGMFDESLNVARNCANTAEGGDPLLYIIALHNYGVALRSHPSSEMKQTAAPVLMKALREAESVLGKDHPTTVIIRNRCGMSAPSHPVPSTPSRSTRGPPHARRPVSSETRSSNSSAPSLGRRKRQSVGSNTSRCNTPLRKKKSTAGGKAAPLPPIALTFDDRVRVKQAIQRLDYGEIKPIEVKPVKEEIVLSRELSSRSTHSATRYFEAPPPVVAATAPMEPLPAEVLVENPSVCSSRTPDLLTLEEVVMNCASTSGERSIFSAEMMPMCQPQVQGGDGVPPSEDAQKESLPLPMEEGSAPLPAPPSTQKEQKTESKSVEKRSDADRKRGASTSSRHLRRRSSSRRRKERRHEERSSDEGRKGVENPNPPKFGSCGGYVNISDDFPDGKPSFLHFGLEVVDVSLHVEPEPPVEQQPVPAGKPPVEPPTSRREQRMRDRILLGFEDLDDMDIEEEEEEEENEEEGEEEEEKDKREAREPKERFEESSVKALASDTEPRSEKKRLGISKIIGTNPATRRQQRIDKERREEEVLRKRWEREAAERARKEHFERSLERIIHRTRTRAASIIQVTWIEWWEAVGKRRRELLNKRAADRERRERQRLALIDYENRLAQKRNKKKPSVTSLGIAIPSVIKCGKKWVEKTACITYAVRKGLFHKGRSNNFFRSLIVKIQAVWRGARDRRIVRELICARQKELQHTLVEEPEEYAAIVIQKFVRCSFARKVRQQLQSERYTPAALKIQRWFRRQYGRWKRLGLDRMSCWRRKYSIRLIQRTWRGYLARLDNAMKKLRFQLDETRRREGQATVTIQRVGRGYLSRCYVSRCKRDVNLICATMYSSEYQSTEVSEQQPTRSPTPPSYIPTSIEEVARVAALEREKYHIGLFVEGVAERERKAWSDALRFRPFEVLRRRAGEDHLCQLEFNAYRRERAAVKIQREFRAWRRLRYDDLRDRTLLIRGRGEYMQNFFEDKLFKMLHKNEYEAGAKLYGDHARPIREMKEEAEQELSELRVLVRTHAHPSELRTREERYKAEEELVRDEELVANDEIADLLNFRRETLMNRFREEVSNASIARRSLK